MEDIVLANYTYDVFWSEDDGEYVGVCSAFPSLSWLEPNPEDAFMGIQRLVLETVSDMLEDGETPPHP